MVGCIVSTCFMQLLQTIKHWLSFQLIDVEYKLFVDELT